MANRLVPQASGTSAWERPTDGTPFRPDYPYTPRGHVDWLNDLKRFNGRKDFWEVTEIKNGGGKPVATVQPIVKLGTDNWERERAAKRGHAAR